MKRLLERVEHRLVRSFFSLPRPLLRRIAGEPRIDDGAELDPALQLLVRFQELRRKPMSGAPPAVSRRAMRRDARVHAGELAEVASVEDRAIAGLRARHYRPLQPRSPSVMMLYFHGGGFVIGDLDTHDAACRVFCRDARVEVLSVDYRLSPEVRFPAAIEDAEAVFRWAVEHAGAARIAVGGDSAGGNLAAVLTQRARKTGGPQPALQLLIYPAVDRVTAHGSLDRFARGYFLSRDDIEWFFAHYAGDADRAHPHLSPLLAEDLTGLPPAVIVTAAFDPLRDEGEAYAERLRAAGVRVELARMPGMLHGFINFGGIVPAARAATIEVARMLGRALDAA